MFGSLRRQLMVGMVLIVASMMSLLIWDLTQRQREVAVEQQTERAAAIARGLAVTSAVLVASRDFAALDEMVRGLSQYPDLSCAMVLDSAGLVLAHNNDPTRRGQYLTDLPLVAELKVLQQGINAFDVASPVMLNGHHIGWVRLSLNGASLEARLAHITRSGLIYTLMALGLSAVFALLTSHYLTRRLAAIAQVAHAVQAGQADLRVDMAGDDEAAQLARQLNNMLDT
ncbi:MAG: GGDEF domain-containing protein, partial [Betaproteobacteria bacterium HGW-Betaproteobacteria-18]